MKILTVEFVNILYAPENRVIEKNTKRNEGEPKEY